MRVTGAFLVYDEKKNRKILIKDIVHCEASVNYTTLHLKHKILVCARTIKVVEMLLVDAGFVRIHRKYLVNTAFIHTISEEKKSLCLSNGKVLEISKRRKHFTS